MKKFQIAFFGLSAMVGSIASAELLPPPSPEPARAPVAAPGFVPHHAPVNHRQSLERAISKLVESVEKDRFLDHQVLIFDSQVDRRHPALLAIKLHETPDHSFSLTLETRHMRRELPRPVRRPPFNPSGFGPGTGYFPPPPPPTYGMPPMDMEKSTEVVVNWDGPSGTLASRSEQRSSGSTSVQGPGYSSNSSSYSYSNSYSYDTRTEGGRPIARGPAIDRRVEPTSHIFLFATKQDRDDFDWAMQTGEDALLPFPQMDDVYVSLVGHSFVKMGRNGEKEIFFAEVKRMH